MGTVRAQTLNATIPSSSLRLPRYLNMGWLAST